MKIKVKHPIIYDGVVLQRGRIYETEEMKIAQKHIDSWIYRRLAEKVEPDHKVDAPVENNSETPKETKDIKIGDSVSERKVYQSKKVDELREIARDMKIEGYSRMKKDELINAILRD